MIIGVSQRVEVIGSVYQERRDSLDQKWFEFLNECEIVAIPLPNNLEQVKKILERMKFDGFLLTGGGDLVEYGGDSPERDSVEKLLIEHAISDKLPLMGVCRGMQSIQNFFGVSLQKVKGHVSCTHAINFKNKEYMVNSFHNWSSRQSDPSFTVTGFSLDGTIEAIEHVEYKIQGIMWHPERGLNFKDYDKELFMSFFKK